MNYILPYLLCAFIIAAPVVNVHNNFDAQEQIISQITSAGAIVIDFETGDELFAYNADVLRDPASMTKMMTVYLVYEAIAKGQIDYDSKVPISEYAENFSRDPNETNVPLSRGGSYTVDQLLDAVVVVSAGGAAQALAEFVGGTRRNFISMMNDKAAEWEIDAHYAGVSGGGKNTNITPRAMATIVRNTILEFPEVLEKTSLSSLKFASWTYQSTNKLLGVYEGIDGFKTGTNGRAGENFSATAQRGNIRIISVTMGSKRDARFDDTTILLDYGFSVVEGRLAEQARLEEEARLIEEERLREAARLEEARLAEKARLLAEEETRIAEEARLLEQAMFEEIHALEIATGLREQQYQRIKYLITGGILFSLFCFCVIVYVFDNKRE